MRRLRFRSIPYVLPLRSNSAPDTRQPSPPPEGAGSYPLQSRHTQSMPLCFSVLTKGVHMLPGPPR